jgi:hypothetical protein
LTEKEKECDFRIIGIGGGWREGDENGIEAVGSQILF